MSELVKKIEGVVLSIVEPLAMELVDVEYRGGDPAGLLRVFIDKPGGVTLDDCQRVSNEIGALLDRENVIDRRYSLEVSSPGLDRKLKKEADFVKFCGSRVNIKLHRPMHESKKISGFIKDCSDSIVHIGVDGGTVTGIELENIKSARLEPEIKF